MYRCLCTLPVLQMYSLLTVCHLPRNSVSVFVYPPCSPDVLPAGCMSPSQEQCIGVYVPSLFSRCTPCWLYVTFPGTMYRCLCTLPVLQMYSLLFVFSSQMHYISVPISSLFCKSVLPASSSQECYVTVCVSSLFCISHPCWFLVLNVANFNFSFKMLYHPPFLREGIKDNVQQTVTKPARYDVEVSTLNNAQYCNILMNGLVTFSIILINTCTFATLQAS